jgi:TRAP-type C4-dicarboxylate transport system substrate-binding protein
MVLDTLSGADSEARRKSGIYEALDKHYAKHNLKVIALPISKASAYNVMLRSPIAGEGDLKGRKIRSTPTYGGVLNLLGASLVVMPPGEVYTSLEKGVVEGATWPALGTLGTRWYEVAKNIARPTFGVAGLMVLVNRDAWTKMPESERALIMAEGRKVEDAWHTEYGRLLELEEKELKAKGAVFTEFGAKFKPQLEQAWSDGIWKLMEEKNGDEARALHALARSKGLSK